MAKKDNPELNPDPIDDKAFQDAIEEKVRQMLDPEIKDPETTDTTTEAETPADEVGTAPVLSESVDDETDQTAEPETSESSDDNEVAVSTDQSDKEAEPNTPVEDSEEHDPEISKAVDDIVATESDELLAANDEKIAKAFDDHKPSRWERFKSGWSAWWRNPLKRGATLAGLTLLLIAVFMIPTSRYFVLNTAGVRGSASLVVLDNSTQQPLKNVEVSLGGLSSKTDKDGRITFNNLKLGKTKLVLHKRAFAVLDRSITLGWGSNPLGDFKITPTGSQYSFKITDYLSGKPISKIEATSGEFSALSDEDGKLKLTLESSDEQATADVAFTGDDFREETVTLNLDSTEEIELKLVPRRKHVFISRRTGNFNVYKIDADGKNEELVLAGSGNERDDLVLVPHPEKDFVALVSTRENARNSDGFLLSTLTLVNLADNKPEKVAQSERVQIIDWSGDKLVYVQIASGASASDPKRHRLMSYSLESGESKELAAANYFNDVLSVGGSLFYAPSMAYSQEQPGFYKLSTEGVGKQTVLDHEVWNVFHTEFDKLVLASGQDWYEYQISNNKVTKLSGQPASLQSHVYVSSPDRKRSLWVDQRDGKGVLLAYNQENGKDDVLHEQSGLSTPVRWLSDTTIVFRVSTDDETADYVMSTEGGEPRKLLDVTNTAGIDRWYYY